VGQARDLSFAAVESARSAMGRHGMTAGGETVLVAVSGGPDSVCLLDVLLRLRDRLDISLEVAHVDHGLSERSEEVAARVARVAAEAGCDVHIARARDLAGPNLQARARAFRYAFFEGVAGNVGAARIATGHTLDDRVETTLARLVHGAGTEGLAGIPPVESARIRPLIELRRAETRAYCRARSLEFFDDPANDDPRYERAAVRAEVLPVIESRWGEGGVRAIAASAQRLREDAEALRVLSERVYPSLATAVEQGVDLALEGLAALPRAVQRRVLEMAVGRIRDRSGGIEAALDALAGRAARPLHFDVASGFEILLEPDRVSVRRPEND
jgi:tRNA(Ile)-lysidine synthase